MRPLCLCGEESFPYPVSRLPSYGRTFVLDPRASRLFLRLPSPVSRLTFVLVILFLFCYYCPDFAIPCKTPGIGIREIIFYWEKRMRGDQFARPFTIRAAEARLTRAAEAEGPKRKSNQRSLPSRDGDIPAFIPGNCPKPTQIPGIQPYQIINTALLGISNQNFEYLRFRNGSSENLTRKLNTPCPNKDGVEILWGTGPQNGSMSFRLSR